MKPEIEKSFWSIVLIGSFNPAIFHPSWLLYHEVISQEQFDSSKTIVIHKDIASIVAGPFTIQVESGRFKIELEDAPEIRLLDFVSKIFGELLPHSRIDQFGLNKIVHVKASDPRVRIDLGRILAPVEPWGDFGKRIQDAPENMTGGMMVLQMREVLSGAGWNGHLEAKIEPSNFVSNNRGFSIAMNKHYNLVNDENAKFRSDLGSRKAIELMNSEFESGMINSDEVIQQIIELASNA